jgi:hypothetical protein
MATETLTRPRAGRPALQFRILMTGFLAVALFFLISVVTVKPIPSFA